MDFLDDMKLAENYHGHICAGQVIGVRMARYAIELLKFDRVKDKKNLIVYVESDRCIADAIHSVTGCKLGKRTLKYINYGKMAATFIDIRTSKGIRLYNTSEIDVKSGEDPIKVFQSYKDEELFKVENVEIYDLRYDKPGYPIIEVRCEICGEKVLDNRHVSKNGICLCKSCLGDGYYKII